MQIDANRIIHYLTQQIAEQAQTIAILRAQLDAVETDTHEKEVKE